MRAAYAILLGFLSGMLIAFVDLHSAMRSYSRELEQILYYTGLDGLTLVVSFLLAYSPARKWWLNLILFVGVFFAVQSLWNMIYAIIAYYTGTLHFPLNLGFGNLVNPEEYFIGILVQLLISFIAYVLYRLTAHPTVY